MTPTDPAIAFSVPGRPARQGATRHVGRGILVESSREVGPHQRVALAAHTAMTAAGTTLLTGAVALRLSLMLPRPKATPKRFTRPAMKHPRSDKLTGARRCYRCAHRRRRTHRRANFWRHRVGTDTSPPLLVGM
jgi:hypothetical protein